MEVNNQQEALEAFENALEVAKTDGDEPAVDAIEKAMIDVKNKIKKELKENGGDDDYDGGDGREDRTETTENEEAAGQDTSPCMY